MDETREQLRTRLVEVSVNALHEWMRELDPNDTRYETEVIAEAVYAEALRDVIEAFRQNLDVTGYMSFSAIDGVDIVTALAEWRGIDL